MYQDAISRCVHKLSRRLNKVSRRFHNLSRRFNNVSRRTLYQDGCIMYQDACKMYQDAFAFYQDACIMYQDTCVMLTYRDECLVQLLNTERPRLGPLPIPHARCRLQPKNLYRSFVSSSRRAKTGYKCHLCSQPFSSARIQVKPLSELSSRTLRIAPIHRCTKTRRLSESEATRVGRYPIQKHVSLLAESVLPTEIMIGVYDRLFDACPPSQLIPKSAGPRFSFASYTGLRNREIHYQDEFQDANVNIKT